MSYSIQLNPRKVEAELAAYLERWMRRAAREGKFQLDDLAREALEHIVSRAFLAGKVKASHETGTPWQIVGNDSSVIQETVAKFEDDFERIMRDAATTKILESRISWLEVTRRLQILAQMLTWRSYNLGKRSEFKRSSARLLLAAQRYKYGDYYMLQTAADDRVCGLCAPHAGLRVKDYDELVMEIGGVPPLHIYCRCEIIAIPTVPLVEKQDRFRERWEREQEEE
ncbi:MAG: hypothetical protein QXO25_03620 [Candidatus Bathyarchaeia archaeon]